MSAPLSEPLFHGTGETFPVGQIIKPMNHSVAHATVSPLTAKFYAESATDDRWARSPQLALYGVVYHVEPVDEKEMAQTTSEETENRNANPDINKVASPSDRYSKKGFRVTGVHSIVPNEIDVVTHREKEKWAQRALERKINLMFGQGF